MKTKYRPKAIPMADDEIIQRIVRRLEKKDNGEGCWLWAGYCDAKGYGQTWWHKRAWWVHRIMVTTRVGRVRAGKDIHHTCGNAQCCNPKHLRVVKPEQNRSRTKGGMVPVFWSRAAQPSACPF